MSHAWTIPIVAVTLSQIAVIATSIYLHRALAHRSLRLHPVADVVFRAILWLTTGQRRQQWVAVHRKHHAFTDREGDPAQPATTRLLARPSLQRVLLRREKRGMRQTIRHVRPDLPEDRLDRALFSMASWVSASGITLLRLVIGFWPGLIAGVAHAGLYVFLLAPLINGLGHWRGQSELREHGVQLVAFSPGSPAGRACTTTTTPTRARRIQCPGRGIDPSWPIIRALAALRLLVIVGPRVASAAGGVPFRRVSRRTTG